MNTGILITMGFVAISSAVSEKICISLGKSEYAEYIRLGGTSLVGASAVGLAISLLNQVRNAFGG